MENIESSIKIISVEDTKGNMVDVPVSMKVHMTPEKQEYIKKLMFSALEDPRKKYKQETMDDVENYWKTAQGC